VAEKSLDVKLRRIRENPNCGDFILADAKDADMAFGVGAPGLSPEMHAGQTRFRSIQEYRDIIRQIVGDELVDILLMSASTSEQLTLNERLFDDSPVTPAVRANDAFDVHVVRGGRYVEQTPRPFRTATLDHIQCGHVDCNEDELHQGPDLGLYSVTFTNNTEADLYTLERYREFRIEAERRRFRHFLEVFNPNLPRAVANPLEPAFVNDLIARSLAGVTERGRPVFLKIVYNGPRAMEELVAYDRNVIVGILGGSAGTTYDAFKLLEEAKKYGARAALFGRKINQAENQFAFIRFLRLLADGQIAAEEAVHAYHGVLQRLGIAPHRSLEDDMQLQTDVMGYLTTPTVVPMNSRGALASSSTERSNMPKVTVSHSCEPMATSIKQEPKSGCGSAKKCGCGCKGAKSKPNFATMTSEERLLFHRTRIAKLFGE
jgi:hypothetical protein